MKYRKNKKNEDISLLGYGCMRFTKKGNAIDLEKAEQEILEAYHLGVNYYDTAYIYPGSEVALGEILKRNQIRENVNIATKMPQYLVHNANAFNKYFDEECKRLQTDYIDYYLMHMFTDYSQFENLKSLGIIEWIEDKKASGAIKNIGFSFHGNTTMFLKILDAYDWDFCQIQYNYMDETTQAGKIGLQAAYEKGIPVIIMEPLRGGKLVNMLPPIAKELIQKHPKGYTAAEWALRWLWNQKEVTCVLSGMNTLEMVEENCRIATQVEVDEFDEIDYQMIESIKQEIQSHMKVGCTACGYCMPCPKGIDIPATFRCYNEMYTEKKGTGRREYMQVVGLQKHPAFVDACISCGKCESHCPQSISIREELKKADKALRPLHYKVAIAFARKYIHR